MLGMLSEAGSTSSPEIEPTASSNITHGIKRDLVQLIGNLCYQCPGNQQQVRLPLDLLQSSMPHCISLRNFVKLPCVIVHALVILRQRKFLNFAVCASNCTIS